MHRNNRRAEKKQQYIIGHALLILPALGLGVLAMICGDVSPLLWGQQLAAWAGFLMLAWLSQREAVRISPKLWSVLLLIPLAATLSGEELDGVKRWLDLGAFQVNAAMLVLPALIAVLYQMNCPFPALMAAGVILSFQPDLSQFIAFSFAMLPLLWQHKEKPLWSLGSILLLCASAIRCIRVPAAVQPVSYCEGILTMLGEMSWILQAAGYIALAAVPIFFVYRFCTHGKMHALSLAVYYVATMLFIFSGEYPVPFMGFGLSPIAGYWLAYICRAPFET